ncbi:MAG: outer membrane protein assembly factor BamD [Acidobacteria bacterium]|nr:outer membrane protein assembly factor BamD [Acidobacteriota bacterium]
MRRLLLVFLSLLLVMGGCRKKVDSKLWTGGKQVPVSQVYQKGLTYLSDGKYAKARQYFQLIIDNAANSKEFSRAKLGIADAEFFDLEKGAGDALADYQSYLVYFPRDKEAPYAQYMVGMCYYSQISSPDRDQSFSHQAIEAFEKLRQKYPASPYSQLSEEKIKACWQRLAQHEFDVGVFYYKARSYVASSRRFEYLLDHYLSYLNDQEKEQTYYFYGRSQFEMTKYDKAARYYRLLLKDFPNTLYHDQVSSELADIDSGKLEKEKKKKIEKFLKKHNIKANPKKKSEEPEKEGQLDK